MTALNTIADASHVYACSNVSSHSLSFSTDCFPFLNWIDDQSETEEEKAVVFRSLVATLKLQPALDVSLEAQAVRFLKSIYPASRTSADAFLDSLASISGDSLTDFVQSIIVLVSSSSQIIISTTMEMLESLMEWSSTLNTLALVKADLIPELIITLNPLSFSVSETVNLHTGLVQIITYAIWLATSIGLKSHRIADNDEKQAVYETVVQQVVAPSEKYICHLCVNRFSIIDRGQSLNFLSLLASLLRICSYYQPAMDFVLNMPVILTIPSCLTFFESDRSISHFLASMEDFQRKWNKTRGKVQQMWKTVYRMLRMEGIEDVLEAKLQNDKTIQIKKWTVIYSIEWNNQHGMNVPERE